MSVLPVAASAELDDLWVTVFGFSPQDLPTVLREFQRCGDILQWGTFGASPQSNYMHIQYQTKYGAQRALLKNGEQLTSTLIVGVKPLDAKHRQLVEKYASASDSPGPRIRAQTTPARPYKVDVAAAQALPQASRSLIQKISEFVLGV
eukprot:jgi/Chrzof1/12940/Cz07g13080.t1